MLLPAKGRGRNGNRNRGRRLTEPSAPLTGGKRKAARARQRLTARDRARVGSRARDPEQRRPHSVRKGRDGLAGSREGAAGAWSPENPATRVGPRPRAHAPEWLRPGAQAGKPPAGASEQASERARAERGARPSASQPSGGGRACAGRGLLQRPWHVHRLLPVPFLCAGGQRSCSIHGPRRDPSSSRTAAARGLGLWSTQAKAA